MLKSSFRTSSALKASPLGLRGARRAGIKVQAALPVDQLESVLTQDLVSLEASIRASLLTLSDLTASPVLMIADGAATATAEAPGNDAVDNGWLQPLVTALETTLLFLQSGLNKLNVPYSYGWSIVLLTLLVKTLTFPLTKKQVESALAMQKLKPQLDALKARYGDNKDQIQKETSILYQEAGVDPLAGCLPSLATIPIFIGLYRSLTSVASDGLLDQEGFFWIPTLAGPTTLAEQKAGLGTAWLFPFVDGHPPIGWGPAACYLALPVAMVLLQYLSTALTSPPINEKDENAQTQLFIIRALPLMIGWFSLNVPAGLSLYYFSNTFITTAQQVYLKKLGGADVRINLPLWTAGTARRSGETVDDAELERLLKEGSVADDSTPVSSPPLPEMDGSLSAAMGFDGMNLGEGAMVGAAAVAEPVFNRRCKRKRTKVTLQAAANALGTAVGGVEPTVTVAATQTANAEGTA